MLIDALLETETGLVLTWKDQSRSEYDYFWLRDNARDSKSFNSQSHQRELYTATLSLDIRPLQAELCADGASIHITWPGSEQPIQYAADFLFEYREPRDEYLYREASLWTDSIEPTALNYSSLDDSKEQEKLVSELQRMGFCIVRDCPRDISSVEAVAGLLGYVRETIFGGVWQFEDNQEMADSAFTSDALRPHNDGTYSHDAPGLQLLLCMDRNASGGDSVLVDGFQVAEQLKSQDPALYQDMSEIELTGIYKGDGHVLRSSRPVFRHDQSNRLVQMTFNNYDRDTIRLSEQVMRRAYEGIIAIDQLLNLRENQWRYVLEEGEMLIFDNWRLLHGRTAYQGKRRMGGTYVNREDFESRLRGFNLL